MTENEAKPKINGIIEAAIHAAALLVAIVLCVLLGEICEALTGARWLALAVWIIGGLALGWYSAAIADRIVTRRNAR